MCNESKEQVKLIDTHRLGNLVYLLTLSFLAANVKRKTQSVVKILVSIWEGQSNF